MALTDTRFHRSALVFGDLFLLSLIWMVWCLPVVTIGPATSALMTVARDWQNGGPVRVIGYFWIEFKSVFKAGVLVGLPWLALGVLIATNLSLTMEFGGSIRYLAVTWLCFVGWLYLCLSGLIFMLLSEHAERPGRVFRGAATALVSSPMRGLMGATLIVALATLAYFLPGSLLISPAIAAHCFQYMWRNADASTPPPQVSSALDQTYGEACEKTAPLPRVTKRV